MNILIVTPAPHGSTRGNRITAERWAGILKELGHRVAVSQSYNNQKAQLLIALHARRSHSSLIRFRQQCPNASIILALTGTDVYGDIHKNRPAQKSLELADRIVVLQPYALRELTPAQRKKSRVIHQSVKFNSGGKGSRRLPVSRFDVCVIGHLRSVKDPFRAAMAARTLPKASRVRIVQVGGALSKQMERRARREVQINRRYRWLGELSRARTLQVLARSRLCVISSRMEGGANVLSEATMARVPVLASRIAGNLGILGETYPGLFRVGDTHALRDLMCRAEKDLKFLNDLRTRTERLAPLFDPEREKRAWAELLTPSSDGFD